MIYFTFYETLSAAVSFLLFGGVFGTLFASFGLLFSELEMFFKLIKKAYKYESIKKTDFCKFKIKNGAEIRNKLILFVADFALIIIFFTFFILLSYAFYDGILRIYFLLLSIVSAIITDKFLGKRAEGFLKKLLFFVNCSLYCILNVIFTPLKVAVKILKSFANVVATPFVKKYKIYTSDKIFKRKMREINVFFKKVP